MSKFNFEFWKNKKVLMCCKTEEEAEDFCTVMHKVGLRWVDGESYISYSGYESSGEESSEGVIYYNFNEGDYSYDLSSFSKDYIILNWSHYMSKEKKFTKSDLKNGDMCVCRNGKVYCAIVDTGCLLRTSGYNALSDYEEDLRTEPYEFDIVQVFRPTACYENCFDCYKNGKLVYDRYKEESVEVSIEEIAEWKKVNPKQIKIVEKNDY